MTTVTDTLNGRLGGADQPHDLAVLHFLGIAQQPQELALGRSWRRKTGVQREPRKAFGIGTRTFAVSQLQAELGVLLGARRSPRG